MATLERTPAYYLTIARRLTMGQHAKLDGMVLDVHGTLLHVRTRRQFSSEAVDVASQWLTANFGSLRIEEVAINRRGPLEREVLHRRAASAAGGRLTGTRISNAFAAIAHPGDWPELDELVASGTQISSGTLKKSEESKLDVVAINALIADVNKRRAAWRKHGFPVLESGQSDSLLEKDGAAIGHDMIKIKDALTSFLGSIPEQWRADKDPQWTMVIGNAENNVAYLDRRKQELKRNTFDLSDREKIGAHCQRGRTVTELSRLSTGCPYCHKSLAGKEATGCGCQRSG